MSSSTSHLFTPYVGLVGLFRVALGLLKALQEKIPESPAPEVVLELLKTPRGDSTSRQTILAHAKAIRIPSDVATGISKLCKEFGQTWAIGTT